jgi:DNA phosphorothioation-associated putative methyltransferase
MQETVGKLVGSRHYFHTSVIGTDGTFTSELVTRAVAIAGARIDSDFNVVRIDSLDESVALLSYPAFFDDACPALARSWKVSIKDQRATLRNYGDSYNPPVLHRKELLLEADDPRRQPFERLTAELEGLGCFDDPVRIGFKLQWERLLHERGFRLVGHQLVPIGNQEPATDQAFDDTETIEIARHLTALSRQNFSAPIQILQRFGYLDGSRTVFDYGCGKGDDLRGLLANGLQAAGWDPHYARAAEVIPARIVNLGFVINVIEDPAERREALRRAFSLAEELLVVSTMVATDNPGKVTLYGDGVLTSRATFQKYYAQAELREYLSSTLSESPISVAPGIFFIFRDKEAEQRFQFARQRGRVRIRPLVRPTRTEIEMQIERRRRVPDKYDTYQALLAPLWARCLELGREPDREEVPNLAEIETKLRSLKKALRVTFSHNNLAQLEQARVQRIDDLKVFLALQQFQRRKPYRTLEPGLQRDIRTFFGDYKSAQEHAKQLLYQVSRREVLDEYARVASELGLGWLEPSHSLQLHSSLVPRLPPALRCYVGCAAVLYGDVTEADAVKIHIRSGKVSFMKYDDFLGKAIPTMTERAKINLRSLKFQLYTYGTDYSCPPLYLKSRYINEELPNYAEQLAFDEALQALNFDLSGYGPSANDFATALERTRLQICGFRLERLHRVPSLDDPCGRFLTYRQLIECGETQANTKISNLPKNPESYTSFFELATAIIDPVIEYFGSIELAYGFCSAELARHVHGRIAPELDQHAANERKRTGAHICPRLGAAVDFLVRDENMREVADWIIGNLPFDRLYYYGAGRPLHVSYGPEHKREAIEMVTRESGRRVPRPLVRSTSAK